jgi:hypothetical protein
MTHRPAPSPRPHLDTSSAHAANPRHPAAPLRRLGLGVHLAFATALLAACGGGGGGDAAPPVAAPAPAPAPTPPAPAPAPTPPAPAPAPDITVAGRAAIGAGLAGATVDIKCTQGSAQATTSASGGFSAIVSAGIAPCALRVSSGALRLHGYTAVANATANLTPLTDLIVGRAAGQLPAAWFDGSTITLDAAALQAARTTVLDALAASGAVLPFGNPLDFPFVIGDAWDRVLDRLVAAIAAAAGQPTLTGLAALDAGYANVLAGVVAGTAGALPALDPEAPSNIDVLTTYAGTYSVTGAATDNPQRGTSTAAHQRGTVTIGADGSVDFDTGTAFTAVQARTIFDRRNQDFDRRVQVSYDADDSGRVINVYLDAERRVTEIQFRHSNAGINIRAAIGGLVADGGDDTPPPPPPPPPPAGGLDGRNGASAIVDGQRVTATGQITSNAIVLSSDSNWNFLVLGEGGLNFNLAGRAVPGPQNCRAGTPVAANLNLEAGVMNTWFAAQCTIELTTVPTATSTNSPIAGRFSGTFVRGPLSITVTDGEFRYVPGGN